MNKLTRYENNGLELVINTQTGEAFASISAVARMTDKDKSTISRYVNGRIAALPAMVLKQAQVNTSSGSRSVVLLNEKQILEVVTKYKPSLLGKFASVGLRACLHQLAGYTVSSTAVEVKSHIRPRVFELDPKFGKTLEDMKELLTLEIRRVSHGLTTREVITRRLPDYLDKFIALGEGAESAGILTILTVLSQQKKKIGFFKIDSLILSEIEGAYLQCLKADRQRDFEELTDLEIIASGCFDDEVEDYVPSLLPGQDRPTMPELLAKR